MIDTKLAVFRVDVSQETGQVMLLIETGCGMRPVLGWPNMSKMEDFANVLLSICSSAEEKDNFSSNSQTDIY
jgi:hypothetical protein